MYHPLFSARRSLRPPVTLRRVTVGLAAATAGFISDAGLVAQVTFETRALSGEAAPDTSAGVTYSGFSRPSINAAGQISFFGVLNGSGVDSTNNLGIWSEAAGSIGSPELVARAGDQAPGTETGVNFDSFSNSLFRSSGLAFNAAGQTAFYGLLTGSGVDSTNDKGIWSEAAGSIGSPGLVARAGDQAPGTETGVNFSHVETTVALNDIGQAAFFGSLTGSGVNSTNDSGIWSEAAGSIGSPGLVAREGDQAPGTVASFKEFYHYPAINDAGQTAFNAAVTDEDGTIGSGIWSEAAGSIGSPGLVVRSRDQAPGTETGVSFSSFGRPTISAVGQTAFESFLTGTGVDSTNNKGIWSEAAGSIGSPGLIAREGSQAPGTEAGVNYSTLFTITINDAGQTAYQGRLTGNGVDSTNDRGIWSEAAGSIGNPGLVARSGSQAPGTETGANFSVFNFPRFNDAGQIAFFGDLTGTGVDSTNRNGIWATDLDGTLNLIVREGDLFDVDNDPINEDFRTVDSILFSTFYEQRDRDYVFNNAGQFVFFASFTDGSSGIFVANTAASSLLGDYNADGFVSQADLDLVLLNWGDSTLPDGFDADAIPGSASSSGGGGFDKLISQNELDGVLLNWGSGTSPNLSAIPEPTSVLVISMSSVGVCVRRRWGRG